MKKKFYILFVVIIIFISLYFIYDKYLGILNKFEEKSFNLLNVETITFENWVTDSDAIKEAYLSAIGEFNESNDSIKINMTSKNTYDYSSELKSKMAANNLPDIFCLWPNKRMEKYVENNRIYPIGQELKKDSKWKSKYRDGIFEDVTFDNEIYGIPQYTAIGIIYYNKEIFDKYNLEPPKTWDEFIANIDVLYENGVTPIAINGVDLWVKGMLTSMLANNLDPKAFEMVKETGNWNTESYIKTSNLLNELIENNAFEENYLNQDYTYAQNLFEKEHAAMYVMGSWELGSFDDTDFGKKVHVFSLPDLNDSDSITNINLKTHEQVIAVSNTTDYIDEITLFLRALTDEKVVNDIVIKEGLYYSTVKSDLKTDELPSRYEEMVDIINSEDGSEGFYDNELGEEIGWRFNETINSITNGENPNTVFEQLSEYTKTELNK
jgi:raffinose/stachyose/melibiose transport system substrate-binding protein